MTMVLKCYDQISLFIYFFHSFLLLIIIFLFLILFYLTLKYCIGFAIYQHESATGIHMFFEIYTVQGCILSLQKEKNALDMSLQKSTVCQTTGRSWLQESPKRFKDYRIPTIRLFDCSACKCLSSFQAIPDSGRCHLLPFPSPMHESEKWKWNRSVVPDS